MVVFNKPKYTMEIILVIIIIVEVTYYVRLKNILKFINNINNRTLHEDDEELSKDMKYILLWTPQEIPRINGLKSEQYLKKHCSVKNCHVTTDKDFLNNLTMYHAIVFDAPSMTGSNYYSFDFPATRSWNQKYIFFSDQPSVDVPFCTEAFDDFFNWTVTFKLNSDFPIPYIFIRDMNGEMVGPAEDVGWREIMEPVNATLASLLRFKTLAAACFEPNFMTESKQERYIRKLQVILDYFQYKVDIFGKRKGDLKCPRGRHKNCLALLNKQYFFYFAFEESLDEDYVTDKILIALNNNVVPVVYGGANYTRFLPPNSFLDARTFSPAEMATKMYYLMMSPDLYKEYFRWKNHYTYHEPPADTLCDLCLALNNKTVYSTRTTYPDFRYWWNSNYDNNCY